MSPLRIPVFRGVWIASSLSNIGGLIQSVGAAWLMLTIAGSVDMVALVQASVALPVMLLSLLAGAAADNFDRRKVMLAAQFFMLAASIALMVFAWLDLITPWRLLLFTFLIGCGMAFNAPAWQAAVGDMVPRAELPSAVALNSMAFNIARSLGPAIGGAIVAAAGSAAAFAVNAASYLPLIAVLARWRPASAPSVLPRETLGTFNAELAEEFWRGVSSSGLMTLHVVLHHGRNSHHIVEGIFKATARALRQAVEPDPRGSGVPSTKGVL